MESLIHSAESMDSVKAMEVATDPEISMHYDTKGHDFGWDCLLQVVLKKGMFVVNGGLTSIRSLWLQPSVQLIKEFNTTRVLYK